MTSNQLFESQSLNDWLFYLESQHPSEIELGLDRTKQVAKQANVLELGSAKVVLVAGTNGKGTTIRFMEQYLLNLGFTVGVYGSPHMFDYNERVRINGEVLDDESHVNAFSHIEQHRLGVPLTYFEFGTLAAFRLLQQANLDFVLVEVGLGGRLDATNILEHDVAVITSLGLDHTDWLGETIEQIGFEKAGIFRKGKPAVVGLVDAPETVFEQATSLQVSRLQVAGEDFEISMSADNSYWTYKSDTDHFTHLKTCLIPRQNIATGITVLNELDVVLDETKINSVIANLSLPGRMQLISQSPLVMVDVAHNPHAVNYLLACLENNETFAGIKKIEVVVAMMKDKDIKHTLSLIKDKVVTWHIAPLKDNNRAATPDVLKSELVSLNQTDVRVYSSIPQAWHQARENQQQETLLLGFGSFYTVAEILASNSISESE